MANFLSFLVPQDKKFFPLFESASGNLLQISKVLVEMVNSSDVNRRRELIKEIERLEHVGDSTTHDIFSELNKTFITPFDREDIHRLTTAIDDIVDYIHGSAKRIELYKIHEYNEAISKLAELNNQAAHEIHSAMSNLRSMKNANRIQEACIKINSIENHADDIFDMTIAKLFEEEKDAINLFKMKEVLSALETATDKCEDVANVLETIILKSN
ncbi:MAG: DUF47 domain-containing protein [Bacteroidetes bacterium]|nr:MAG: DUF47 domain-containing protein [Bacteroidota bacterium]REK00955.1 MAG: DUF47 domain-containing protein [Bacteroidota bacterium]